MKLRLMTTKRLSGSYFHLWQSFLLDLDGWRDLDATRPSEAADATHIQLGASDPDGRTSTDMAIQLLRFFGKFTLEVESAE